jgi:hypothetical protein
MIMVFMVGIISGAITMAIVLSMPTDVPLFTFSVQTSFLLWITNNSRIIAATLLALLMSFGLISVINNIQDILTMRVRLRSIE